MRSYESLQEAIGRDTVEHAKRLRLSLSAVSKWKEPAEDYTDSGALNPLDRIETVIETALSLGRPVSQAHAPVHYLGERFGLIVIPLPKQPGPLPVLTDGLLKMIQEFGDVTKEVSGAILDGQVSKIEFKRIEKEGNDLIRQVADFIQAAKAAAGRKA